LFLLRRLRGFPGGHQQVQAERPPVGGTGLSGLREFVTRLGAA